MLVLTRKEHEKIIIKVDDTEIIVCVVRIRSNRTQIGITAPKGVDIFREELLIKIQAS